jgi:hypothetical protein
MAKPSGGLKGNNGRASKRKLYRKLAFVLGAFGSVFLILYLIKSPEHRNIHHTIRNQLRKRLVGSPFAAVPPHDPNTVPRHHTLDNNVNANNNADDNSVLQQILRGEIHLVDISFDHELVQQSDAESHVGLTGHFCKLEWHLYKADPSALAMFHVLKDRSPDCAEPVQLDLNQVVQAAREYDATGTGAVHLLDLTAVVFHESRCGSTLVANIFAAMHPASHRVYSESGPSLAALTLICGESYERCSELAAANMLRDVIYLYSRSNDPAEKRLFLKMQSKASRHLPAFSRAYPETPRLFVYRDPVQVLQSHLKSGRNALCLHQTPPAIVQEAAARHHREVDANTHPEDYCAAHLSSITDAAVEALQDDVYAIPVNYADLPARLYEEIIPGVLNLEVGPSELHRMEQVAGQYSKGGGAAKSKSEDSEKKSATASQAVKDAAVTFLEESYEALEAEAAEAKARYALLVQEQ